MFVGSAHLHRARTTDAASALQTVSLLPCEATTPPLLSEAVVRQTQALAHRA